MNLKDIVTQLCERTSLPVPVTVMAATDKQIVQMRALVVEGCEDLAQRGQWDSLINEAVWTSLAREDQGLLTTIAPNGYDYFIKDSFWDRSSRFPLTGGLTSSRWQGMKAAQANGPRYTFRTRGGHLLVNPVPPAGATWAFEYLSTNWIQHPDQTFGDVFTSDLDEILFPDRIVKADLRWRWKREKGLDYAEDFAMFEGMVANALSRDSIKMDLDLSGPCGDAYPNICMPTGSWLGGSGTPTPPVTPPDTPVTPVAPVLSSAGTAELGTSTVTPQVTTTGVDGTLFGVIVPQGDAPTAAQIILGQQSDGTPALRNFSLVISFAGLKIMPQQTGLTIATGYTEKFAHRSAAALVSNVAGTDFTTGSELTAPVFNVGMAYSYEDGVFSVTATTDQDTYMELRVGASGGAAGVYGGWIEELILEQAHTFYLGPEDGIAAGGIYHAQARFTSVSGGVLLSDDIILTAGGVATAIILTGPSTGPIGAQSTDFTVHQNGAGTTTFTPTSSLSGVDTFVPSSLNLIGTAPQTFKDTPSTAGARNINGTNTSGLTAPSSVVYTPSGAAVVLKFLNNQAPTGNTTTFPDQSPSAHVVTVTGTPIWVTRPAFVWASGDQTAVSLDFIGGWFSFASHADFGYGLADFTIKMRYEQANFPTIYPLLDQRTAAPDVAPVIYVKADGTLAFHTVGADLIASSPGLVTSDTLAHEIMWSRVSGVSYMFYDGVLLGSVADTHNYIASPVRVGRFWDGGNAVPGCIAALVITKGLGEHTTTYTPGTLPY